MNVRIYLSNGIKAMMEAKTSEEVQMIYEKAMGGLSALSDLKMIRKEDFYAMGVELFDLGQECVSIIEAEK